MSIYQLIYNNLCASKKQLFEQYKPGSGLHAHHIIPRHNGGTDDLSNITYLTVREHRIAHFLLWKIHRNPNDLRSMHMLGAKLTPAQRRITGIFCRDNKLGFFNYTKEQRSEWSRRGIQTQKESGSEQTFYFWSTEEGRQKRATMGGKASIESGNNPIFTYWMSPEGLKQRASMGGKAHTGKVWMYKNKANTRITKDKVDSYLADGWTLGFLKKL